MKASADNSHMKSTVKSSNERVLTSALLFGANASGKSNILEALSAFRQLICGEASLKGIYKPHFTSNHPTELDIIFAHCGIRYAYGVSFDDGGIISKYLYHWPNGREALVFSRKGGAIKLPKSYQALATLAAQTGWDELFLKVACNQLTAPYEWLTQKLHFAAQCGAISAIGKAISETMCKLLLCADLGIADFQMNANAEGSYDVMCMHWLTNAAGESAEYRLPLADESQGVKRLFSVLLPIVQALYTGGIAVIDDLDVHLHPILLRELLGMFQNSDSNPGGGQLIGAVHDIMLLDLNLLRRDQICFVNRHAKTQATETYSLWDFSARKDENVQRGYLQNRYGAVPFIEFDR